MTDILVWQEDAGLVNAALDRSTGLSTATAPYRQLTPQDINGDGVYLRGHLRVGARQQFTAWWVSVFMMFTI